MAKFRGRAVITVEGQDTEVEVCVDVDDRFASDSKEWNDMVSGKIARRAVLGWYTHSLSLSKE